MDWASISDFHQPCPRVCGHVALDGDVTGNLANSAVLGFAIRTVLCVDLAVRQTYGEALRFDTLPLGIEPHRHRGTGTESGEKILIGAGTSILTANGNRLICHEHMAPGPHALEQMPVARLAHLDAPVR